MAGFQEHFLRQLKFILGACRTENIFTISCIVTDSANAGA